MDAHAEKQLVRVKDRRMRDGKLEGLCEFDDGSEEWRQPSSVEVEIVNDRTGERVEGSNVRLGGVPCA